MEGPGRGQMPDSSAVGFLKIKATYAAQKVSICHKAKGQEFVRESMRIKYHGFLRYLELFFLSFPFNR